MTPQPIPADLQALHAQIVDCEARGFTCLAAALRPMLDRQIRERGIVVVRFTPEPPDTVQINHDKLAGLAAEGKALADAVAASPGNAFQIWADHARAKGTP